MFLVRCAITFAFLALLAALLAFSGMAGGLVAVAKATFFLSLLALIAVLILGFLVYRKSGLLDDRADGEI